MASHPVSAPPDAASAADVLERLPVPIALRDAAGGYVYRNRAHRHLAPETFAGDAGDLEALGIAQVTDPASGRAYLRSRTPWGDGADLLEVLEDITGRHSDRGEIARQRDALARHADALGRANRELGRVDRAKAEFIALAAHEIRTPLTALGNALALLRRLPGGVPEGERFLAMAERNVGRLATLADDLLAYTKLELGQLAPTLAPADLGALVDEVRDALAPEAERRGVRVARGRHRRPFPMHADRGLLLQVVRDLVVHAVEHAPEGATVRVSLRHLKVWPAGTDGDPDPADAPVPPAPPEGWLELAVSDPGGACVRLPLAGLGPDTDGMADGAGGLGLDLAVCRRIADMHAGALWAREAPEGRHLVLRVPRLAPADARLLPVQAAWRRLRRGQETPGLVVLRPADPRASPADLAALGAACAGAAGPGGHFAPVPETGEVVGVTAGPEAPARLRALLNGPAPGGNPGSSLAGARPIRMGWSSGGEDGAPFGAALARARAAVGTPHRPPDGTGRDADTGEGGVT